MKKSINADGSGKAAKGQLDEGNRQYYSGNSQDNVDQVADRCFDLQLMGNSQREEFPKSPPVRLKSEDKLVNMNWEEKIDHHGSGAKHPTADHAFMIGSYLDVPIGQEITSSGGRRTIGSSWLSVSQGIAEDTSDLVSGFATIGDDSLEYPNEYWDSDEYDDDYDVGYTPQPIEDETWFLAHEIDYSSENEKPTGHTSGTDRHDHPQKDDDDDQSFVEEDSYISGEQYFHGKNIAQEHLLIVCELLKAKLYEFQGLIEKSGGEIYFTMPRLQSISIQCLEHCSFCMDLVLFIVIRSQRTYW